ncbi:3' terminal RNA ribose 2'-O-methyltransferase Hen1 [Stackebrandtia nassauensis]|uniref:Small RNA 2'-O-methyltransferase n=1 Tax=Stackebrandtia nassauensis (strain DSM 44728 / CIP 108903 / NRRL B-16338 / NBRC 102104 / LLR-40K-21) TaxID=446470 RepID=D3Q922_STANL|nr:3' terminal RNA ribose 2'-O-methyltransferase Hen1 [Stackebrandtia nassauensis]ADD40631.1 Methyltransferase type 12 [Stackebrandtia nassauensis DSM 44728]
MLLTISTTHEPATDLGYLLYKHPDRVRPFSQSFGTATVFYPEATEKRCTAALLLEVDPVKLTRSRGKNAPDFSLGQYVNDRPYAASSLLAVALGDVYSTARNGRCDSRPELAASAIPLEIFAAAVPCRGGPQLAAELFEPLGWTVSAEPVPLDASFPDWGDSRYVQLRLTGTMRLADALNHLYVLLPVLDDAKHYWVDIAEVDKLVRGGGDWLADHPRRSLIARRYLARKRGLERVAFARLAEVDETGDELEPPVDEEPATDDGDVATVDAERPASAADSGVAVTDTARSAADGDRPTDAAERPQAEGQAAADGAADQPQATADGESPAAEAEPASPPLNKQRHAAVLAAVAECGASSVIDLGCGSGKLLSELVKNRNLTRIAGVDASTLALKLAARHLKLDRLSDRQAERLSLFQAALTYTDDRLAGYDAAVLMEVIEHVDPPRLAALAKVVFGSARPATVIVTTPNVEYNVHYELEPGRMRHSDHRFEWNRDEFRDWATDVATSYGYTVAISGVGDEKPETGCPTQMGVFTRG